MPNATDWVGDRDDNGYAAEVINLRPDKISIGNRIAANFLDHVIRDKAYRRKHSLPEK